jgi:hypothetical protein
VRSSYDGNSVQRSSQEPRAKTLGGLRDVLDRPAPEPFPLEAVDVWTAPRRAALAARHEERAARAAAQGRAAWDIHGRRVERESDEAELVATSTEWDPVQGAWGWARTMRPGSVSYSALGGVDKTGRRFHPEKPATVKRVRRRWKAYRTKSGKARRCQEVLKVEIPAFEAFAKSAEWHASRAAGQRSRRETVSHCGKGTVSVTCKCCELAVDAPIYCGVVRLCDTCTRRRSDRTRGRLWTALDVVWKNAERAGTFRRNRQGGTLGERHIVLTAPHVTVRVEGESSAVARYWTARARVELLFRAWGYFSRRLAGWMHSPWSDVGPTIGACWHRAFEWTYGSEDGDGAGHPHFHMYALTPWIPEWDDHRIGHVADGQRRPTTACKAQDPQRGAWGWAETMRRERCPQCVAPADREAFREQPFALRWQAPVVERRSGVRTWWCEALRRAASEPPREIVRRGPKGDEGPPRRKRGGGVTTVPKRGPSPRGAELDGERFDRLDGYRVEHSKVNLTVRAVVARPGVILREVQKSRGFATRNRRAERFRLEARGGQLIDYFEGWSLATVDRVTWKRAGAEVLAGVHDALEGRRLSQSSEVHVLTSDGEVKRVGLMGIADRMYDAFCRKCADELGVVDSAERNVEVVSWSRACAARIAAPKLPPASGPPPPAAEQTQDARIASLVHQLRLEEPAARAAAVERVARLHEVCELVRTEGPSLLPTYRRTKGGSGRRQDTMGARLRRALGIGWTPSTARKDGR